MLLTALRVANLVVWAHCSPTWSLLPAMPSRAVLSSIVGLYKLLLARTYGRGPKL
jgi:hypothetical protein